MGGIILVEKMFPNLNTLLRLEEGFQFTTLLIGIKMDWRYMNWQKK